MLTKLTENINTHQSLPDSPALTSAQLKKKFDEAPNAIKDYINNTLTGEIDEVTSGLRTDVNSANQMLGNLFNLIYPVGSIYLSVNSENPSIMFGGTWQSWGAGRVPVGVSTETEFNTVEKTGGAKTHTLTVAQIPSHGHSVSITSSGSCTTSSNGKHSHTVGGVKTGTSGSSQQRVCSQSTATTHFETSNEGAHTHTVPNHTHTVKQSNAGGGGAHNNLQPYITCYMWKRIA